MSPLETAREVEKPVAIHCRNAVGALFPIVELWAGERHHLPNGRPLGVMHYFSEDAELASRYVEMGSEKKGLPTTYYLTIADTHIFSHSELEFVNLVVLNDTNSLFSGNPLNGMVDGGAVFMQSHFTEPADVWARIPAEHKATILKNNLRIYFIDMVSIAREVASVADLEMRMQGIVLLGAFLKLTPYARTSGMDDDEVYAGVEKALRKYFGNRGEQVVQDNLKCVKRGYGEMQEVTRNVMTLEGNGANN